MILSDGNDYEDGFEKWYERLSEEEKAALQRKADLRRQKTEKHPLYVKAREVLDIVMHIVASLPEEERVFHAPVVESAMMLAPKFMGVCNTDMWLVLMQNAALMRYHAEYVTTGTYGFNIITGEAEVDERYIELLRNEMKEYKRLFNEWMEEAHAMPRDPQLDNDEWGVFVRA